MTQKHITVPMEEIAAFCDRWKVRELSLFGSVLRDDFRPDSDVDVLISFHENSGLGLWDLSAMQEELEGLFGRTVDLAVKEGLRNPFRRHLILTSREIIYAA